jgi:hypothetical protein
VPQAAAPEVPQAEVEINGGKRRMSSALRAIGRATHNRVMENYRMLKAKYPNEPGNVLLKKAMKRSRSR